MINTSNIATAGSPTLVPGVPAVAAPTTPVAAAGTVKDSRWLTMEVCREFQRNKCSRNEFDCKFAHPPPHVEVQNGRVVCCYDSIKGKCQRKDPPCKYLHPPQHLREQLLQNGRNNLILKNIHMQLLQQQLMQGSLLPIQSYLGSTGTPSAAGPGTLYPGSFSLLSPSATGDGLLSVSPSLSGLAAPSANQAAPSSNCSTGSNASISSSPAVTINNNYLNSTATDSMVAAQQRQASLAAISALAAAQQHQVKPTQPSQITESLSKQLPMSLANGLTNQNPIVAVPTSTSASSGGSLLPRKRALEDTSVCVDMLGGSVSAPSQAALVNGGAAANLAPAGQPVSAVGQSILQPFYSLNPQFSLGYPLGLKRPALTDNKSGLPVFQPAGAVSQPDSIALQAALHAASYNGFAPGLCHTPVAPALQLGPQHAFFHTPTQAFIAPPTVMPRF